MTNNLSGIILIYKTNMTILAHHSSSFEIQVSDFMKNDIAATFSEHLAAPTLNWLLGAGISFGANIPLMYPLTRRVEARCAEGDKKCNDIFKGIKAELPEDAHVEFILTHLADYIDIAKRSKGEKANIINKSFSINELNQVHQHITGFIAETIRYGYIEGKPDDEQGSKDKSIIKIDDHQRFINAVFRRSRANIGHRRAPVKLFTTNYDTLLEDALALERVPYFDGFTGGAVAFWNQRFREDDAYGDAEAVLCKLHGSIDWYAPEKDGGILRVRDADTYPSDRNKRVLIYPQATKYQATQKDPFATLFDRFRRTLRSPAQQTLAVCGYSFGDDHINDEIENAMNQAGNKLTLLAFSDHPGGKFPDTLERWRDPKQFGDRVLIAAPSGLYQGAVGPEAIPENEPWDWWTFGGVINLLTDGFPVKVMEE